VDDVLDRGDHGVRGLGEDLRVLVGRRCKYRHTYATMSLAAGVSLFSLARRMGTSVEMIDRTYGHLAPDAEEYERTLLDAYDAKSEAFGHGSGIGSGG
jgi:integrase